MTRIASHFIKRESLKMFYSTWEYCAPVTPDYDRFAWQYHVWATNVRTGQARINFHDAPREQQYSPITATEVRHNECVDPAWFWPTPGKECICTDVLMDAYINYGFQPGNNGERSCVTFHFERPKVPTVRETRTNNVLSWEINANSGSMSDTSEYNRQRTRWYVQRQQKGTSYPAIKQYDLATFSNVRTGDWSQTPKGFKGAHSDDSITVRFTEHAVSPDTPYAVRIVVYNDGFAGASDAVIREHVFCKPNPPVVSYHRVNETEMVVNVNPRWEFWHQTESMKLQYQVASVLDNSSGWQDAGDPWTDMNGIKLARLLTDSRPARIPPTDKATWYRVVSEHDDSANVAVSNVLPSAYIAPPSAPTISSCELQSNRTIAISITPNSNMHVDTYISVSRISDGVPKEIIPAYIPTELTNHTIMKNGSPALFNIDDVYVVSVYNKVVNSPSDTWRYAVNGDLSKELPSSEYATQTVRGSAGAIAQADLGEITITRLTTNPSGKGITLEWESTPDTLSIKYDDVGTYVEWTDADGGWISTESPKSHKVADGGNDSDEDGEGDGMNHGTVSIDGLTEGTVYQIRLRRYVTLDGEDGYGRETTTVAVPWSTPSKPTLTAPGYVLPGESVRYMWTFTDEGDTPQSSAILTVNDMPYAVNGSMGSFILDVPDSLEGETLTATVRVSANGAFSEPSDEVVTTVAERPTCTLSLPTCVPDEDGNNILTALPLSVSVGGSGDMFRVRVTASGNALSPEPSGGRELTNGEVAASDVFSGDGTYDMDGSLIVGGGSYNVTCVCVDTTTGMESEPVTVGFSALWADPAVIPIGTVEIEGGMAYITPIEGANAPEGESCRIWRKVADGYVLACERAIWGERHLDRVPAYGSDELAYVIEAVSADGDHKWSEVPYELSGQDVRITYGSETVVLPWNLTPKSSYSKSFERRAHMDGHRAGFWEPGANQDWTSNSEIEKNDRALADRLRDLGRYDRLCYVRGPFGVAFAANVNLDVSDSYNRGFTSVSMTCAEVEDDGSFAIVVEPQEDDGA